MTMRDLHQEMLPDDLLLDILTLGGAPGGALVACRHFHQLGRQLWSDGALWCQYLIGRHGKSSANALVNAIELLESPLDGAPDPPPCLGSHRPARERAESLVATLESVGYRVTRDVIHELAPYRSTLYLAVFRVILERHTDMSCAVLVEASAWGDTEVVMGLLDAGLRACSVHAGEALARAALGCHLDTVGVLLDSGIDPNVMGGHVLVQAAADGFEDIVRAMLVAGADPNLIEGEALVQASWHGHEWIVRDLLAAGADPNLMEGEALVQASRQGHTWIVKTLLAAGADSTLGGNVY